MPDALLREPPVANSLGKHRGAWTLTQTNRPFLIAHEKGPRRREGGRERLTRQTAGKEPDQTIIRNLVLNSLGKQ